MTPKNPNIQWFLLRAVSCCFAAKVFKRTHLITALLLSFIVVSCDTTTTPPQASNIPRRIISLSPNVTEILYGIGAFERVIAVSKFCDYPAQVASLPRLGGWTDTNIEQLTALRPDIVIVTQAQEQFVNDRLKALGIPLLVVPDRSLDDALNAIQIIGDATGDEANAKQLLAETQATLESVRSSTRDLNHPRVLLVADRVPGSLRGLYVASGESYLTQLVEVAGGESIKPPEAGAGYVAINKEALIEFDPEIIIDMVQSSEGKFAEDPRAVWNELPTLRAVRDNRVVSVRDTYVLHPSQFVGKTAQAFARIIHPQAFSSDDKNTTNQNINHATP